MKNTVFIFLILMISSCEKDDSVSQVKYAYLNETLRTNFAFNKGSYWVYQNSTNEIDSVVLINSKTGFTSPCPRNQCAKNEFIELNFSSVTKKTSYNHYLMSNYIKYNGGGDWGEDGQPVYISEKESNFEFNGLIVGKTLDSLMILNTMYYNIEKMSVRAERQFQKEFKYNRDLYFVPSVGVVRQVIYDPVNGTETWDLKNYRIE